jgi:hypothetical protein
MMRNLLQDDYLDQLVSKMKERFVSLMEKVRFNFFHIHIEVCFTLAKPSKNNPANILSLSTRVPPFSNSKTMMTNFPSGLGIKQELCDDALH